MFWYRWNRSPGQKELVKKVMTVKREWVIYTFAGLGEETGCTVHWQTSFITFKNKMITLPNFSENLMTKFRNFIMTSSHHVITWLFHCLLTTSFPKRWVYMHNSPPRWNSPCRGEGAYSPRSSKQCINKWSSSERCSYVR